MGETNKVVQGEGTKSTGQTNPQQVSQQTSDNKDGTTSKQPRTFTESEYEKEVSDRVTLLGRRYGDLEAREAVIKGAEAQRQKEEEEKELAELEEVTQEKPEAKLDLLAYKKKLAEQKRELIRREAEIKANETKYADKFKKAEETEFEITVFDIANKYEVDAGILKDKADRLKLRDKESIDEIASVMPKKVETAKPDSGKTIGGTDWRELSPDAKIRLGTSKMKI